MSNTKIKAGQFSGIVGNGTDGYFLMTNGDGTMAWAEGGATGPSVTSVSYPGDDLAADPAGGQTVVLTGANFGSSMTVSIGGTTAPSIAHDSNTQLTITTPAKAAGDYDIVVTNTVTGASGTFVNGISYNGIPTWTTAAGSLGTFESETTISTITLQATEPDGGTITFNITNGALPTGLSLTGANIDGTTTAESSTTLYSFTIEAIDNENQATPRNFSITVNSAEIFPSENFTINTYTGNGSTQSIEGKIGAAASFNGTTSQIRTVGNPIPSTSSVFTVSFWFQLDNTNTNNHIFSIFDNVTGTNKLLIRALTAGDFQAGVYGTSGSNFITTNSSTFSYTTGVWYHLVYISTSTGDNELWIDGVQKGTSSGVAANTTSSTIPITMGGRGDFGGSTTERFGGKLDQVRIFDKALSSSEVTTLSNETNASSTKSTTDIFDDGSGVALYEFEEGAKDTGGASGKFGSAAIFNGSSSVITNASRLGLGTNPTHSVSLWVNFAGTQNQSLYGFGDTTTNFVHSGIQIDSSLGRIYHDNRGNADALANYSFSIGQWYHIVFTYDSSTSGMVIYINGTQVSTATRTLNITSPSFRIGRRPGSNNQYVNGKIDEFRVYSDVLTPTEVEYLYNNTTASIPTDYVAYYKLDGDATDETGSYNGTATNVSYAYDGTPTNINFLGMAFQPDFVWIKNRSTVSNHILQNTVAGINTPQYSDETYLGTANSPFGHVDSVESNGFTVDDGGSTEVNANSLNHNFVAWCWKAGGVPTPNNNTQGTIPSTVSANQGAGFSIVKYTGNGSTGATVGHGLSATIDLLIVKNLTDGTQNWRVQASPLGGTKGASLNTADAFTTASYWNNTDATDTVFTVDNSAKVNATGDDYIAYCFHSVDGYQKVGSYLGGTAGVQVTTGFKPRWVMLKNTTTAGDSWLIFDTIRSGETIQDDYLLPNASNAEGVNNANVYINVNDTGFTVGNTFSISNGSGNTYIYLAIA